MRFLRPPGTMATVVGGLLGAGAGFGVGLLIANLMPVDDNAGLEALGAFLLVVFLTTCTGGAVGSGIALAFRHQRRPTLTGVLALFGLIASLIATLRWFGEQSGYLVVALLIVDFAVTLYLVRVLAMLGTGESELRGE